MDDNQAVARRALICGVSGLPLAALLAHAEGD